MAAIQGEIPMQISFLVCKWKSKYKNFIIQSILSMHINTANESFLNNLSIVCKQH